MLGLAAPVGAVPITFAPGSNSLKLNGGFAPPAVPKAKTLRQQAADAMERMDYDATIAALDKAIALDPTNPELKQQLFTVLQIAGTTYAKAMPNDAIALLKRAIAMKPDTSILWTRLGEAHCQRAAVSPRAPESPQDVRKCIAYNKKAIALAKDKPDAISRFAMQMSDISPVMSAQLFDLSAREYLAQGKRDRAKTTLWVKSVILQNK